MNASMVPDTIISRLANTARLRPGAAAIIEGDTRVSYAELDANSIAIAHRVLSASNTGSGNVAIFFADKIPAIAAVYGAIRSGHACVPMEVGDPAARLRIILEDCAPVALLTDGAHAALAQSLAPASCAIIDIGDAIAGTGTAPLPTVMPDDLVYVSYTSGSTGRPKGVTQTHANLLFFMDSYATAFGIGPRDRMTMLYALGVPAGLGDVLRIIGVGATMCVYDVRRKGITDLADWLDRERITFVHAVPTVVRQMASRLGAKRVLPHLRVVHMGGEAVFAGDVALVRAHTLGHCVVVNQLASTEVGMVARNIMTHDVPIPSQGVIAAGRPIDGVRVEILRADGAVAAEDEIGEIFASSAHTSPGYWRRPDLDAIAFSADPARPGWRRYRSGDLGRIDAEGTLWFVGRSGGRVKVNGHSVDLMEVEAALAACPGVARAAVLAKALETDSDSSRLTAYVEMAPGGARDPVVLRRQIADHLPLYMLPASMSFVSTMPLTVGGKIDRGAIEATSTLPPESKDSGTAPRDEVERTVARVIGELLKLDDVAADDDFYLLGGDSLMGAELQARLAQTFGVRVDSFHETATVAGIAAGIRGKRSSPTARALDIPVLVPLWPTGDEIPLFIVHGRNGQAFVSPLFMHLLGNDQPVWSFQARGLDGVSAPHASVEAMADDYLGELRRVRPHGPYFLGSLCAGVFIVTVMARRLRAEGETVLPLLLLDPPNSVFQPGFLSLTQQQFEHKMRVRKANGRTGGPVDDPVYMQALIRTVLAFERAIATHRPQPYDGDAFMLSSTERVQGADAAFFERMFPGNVVRHEIGATHRHAMSPQNPAFTRALLDSLQRIRDRLRVLSG